SRIAWYPNPPPACRGFRRAVPTGSDQDDPGCSVAPARGAGGGVDPCVSNPRLVDEDGADACSQREEVLGAVQEVGDAIHSLGKLDLDQAVDRATVAERDQHVLLARDRERGAQREARFDSGARYRPVDVVAG